eukprot:1938489-Amphidinium_carterae.1
MQLDTRGHCLSVRRQLHLPTFLVPVEAAEDNVREIFWFLLTSHTERSYMKRTIRTDFMPDPSKGGVEGTTKAVFCSVGTLLQVPVTLGAEAGLQTTKIRTMLRNSSKQRTSRVPLDFVISFTPSE